MSTLTITGTDMVSDTTKHTARAWPVPGEPTLWSVTWLPGRALIRDQAITAMTIAEVVADHDVASKPPRDGHPLWAQLGGWAAELGISAPAAVVLSSASPEQIEARKAASTILARDDYAGRRRPS